MNMKELVQITMKDDSEGEDHVMYIQIYLTIQITLMSALGETRPTVVV